MKKSLLSRVRLFESTKLWPGRPKAILGHARGIRVAANPSYDRCNDLSLQQDQELSSAFQQTPCSTAGRGPTRSNNIAVLATAFLAEDSAVAFFLKDFHEHTAAKRIDQGLPLDIWCVGPTLLAVCLFCLPIYGHPPTPF